MRLSPAVLDEILDKVHLGGERPIGSVRFPAVRGRLLGLALPLPRVPVPQVAPPVLAFDSFPPEQQNSDKFHYSHGKQPVCVGRDSIFNDTKYRTPR